MKQLKKKNLFKFLPYLLYVEPELAFLCSRMICSVSLFHPHYLFSLGWPTLCLFAPHPILFIPVWSSLCKWLSWLKLELYSHGSESATPHDSRHVHTLTCASTQAWIHKILAMYTPVYSILLHTRPALVAGLVCKKKPSHIFLHMTQFEPPVQFPNSYHSLRPQTVKSSGSLPRYTL